MAHAEAVDSMMTTNLAAGWTLLSYRTNPASGSAVTTWRPGPMPSQEQLCRAIAHLADKLPPDTPLSEDVQDIVDWALERRVEVSEERVQQARYDPLYGDERDRWAQEDAERDGA